MVVKLKYLKSSITYLSLFVLTIGLSGCGSSGSNSDNTSDSGGEEASTEIQITISANAEGDVVSSILAGESGVTQIGSDGKATIPFAEEEHVVVAINELNKVIWLAISTPEVTQLDIGPKSTAHALLKLFPYITSIDQLYPTVVQGILEQDTLVLALENQINETPSWSDMTDANLLSAYSDALISVVDKINTNLTNIQTSNLKTISNVETNKNINAVIVVGDTNEKSGITLTVTGESSAAVATPKFSLKIENEYARWIKVVVGADENGNNPMDVFDVSADNFFTLGNSNVTRSYNSEDIPVDKLDDTLFVDVYGPGLGGSSGDFYSAEDGYYYQAAVYTLLSGVVSPTLGVITGAENCIASIFDPKGSLNLKGVLDPKGISSTFFYSILGSNDIEQQVKSNNYSEAGLEIVLLGLNAINNQAIECLTTGIAKQIAQYLLPILGEVKVLMKVTELSTKLAPVAYTWAKSNKYEQWEIENKVTANLYLKGVGSVTSAIWGRVNYTYADDLTASMMPDYIGDCPVDDDTVTCEGYTFEGEGPYTMSFSASCVDLDGYTTPCKKAFLVPNNNAFETQTYDANEDGEIIFTYAFDNAKEYQGFVEVVDLDGATKQHSYYIQIKVAGVWGQSEWDNARFGL